jgi:xylulokinase
MAMGKYVIAIDLGTQGTKTVLFDEDLNAVANSFVVSNLISPTPFEVHQDPDEIFQSVVDTVKDVLKTSGVSPKDICSVGLDGQMSGIMGIDHDWNAATYYDSWLDTRCEKYMGVMKERYGTRMMEISGGPVTYDHGSKIIWWKNEHPEAYAKTYKYVLPHVYVIGRMCGLKGEDAFIDYTNLHFTGFADNLNKTWSEELLEPFGIDGSKMPEIVDPYKTVGRISRDFAALTGLMEGMPVVAGSGDQAATALGAGIVKKGMVYDVGGTASVFSFFVGDYKPDTEFGTFLQMRSIIDGNWQPLGYTNGSGLCLRWFRDEFASREGKVTYDDLSDAAKDIAPGCGGLVFIPHFSGRVMPNDPYVRGSWIGLKFTHKREHLWRAIMEGIAYEYKFYQEAAKAIYPDVPLKVVYAIGGGAKSRLFNTIKCDVLGIPYAKLKASDSALIGSAVVAGYGVGLFENLTDPILKVTKIEETIQPNMDRHAAYVPFFEVYKDVIELLHKVYMKEGFQG